VAPGGTAGPPGRDQSKGPRSPRHERKISNKVRTAAIKSRSCLTTSLKRALDTAQTLPLDQLSPEPHLKLSGIAIVLGAVLEANNKLQGANNTYVAAYERLLAATDRTGPEKARAGAIAYKLGQLAESQNKPQEERRWYEAACKDLLGAAGLPGQRQPSDTQPVDLAELSLPEWVSKMQLVEPLRALAGCYSRNGDHQYVYRHIL
jgi:hypothetical protein